MLKDKIWATNRFRSYLVTVKLGQRLRKIGERESVMFMKKINIYEREGNVKL